MKLIIPIIMLLVGCSFNLQVNSSEKYSEITSKEEYLTKFFINDKRVIHVDTTNPNGDLKDGIGQMSVETPKYGVRVYVEFDIFGYVNLNMVDSCFGIFETYKGQIDSTKIPKEIYIIKYSTAARITDKPEELGGLSYDGTKFIISEVALNNYNLFPETLVKVFALFIIEQLKGLPLERTPPAQPYKRIVPKKPAQKEYKPAFL